MRHRPPRGILPLGAILLAVLLLGACGAAIGKAPPPASSGLGAPLAVNPLAGQKGFSFGPYTVRGIQGEKPDQADWRFVGRQGLVMNQAVSFVMSGQGDDWYCRCALGDNRTGMPLNIGTLWGHGFSLDPTQGRVLACIMRPQGGGATWRMSLYAPPAKWKEAGRDPTIDGALSDGAEVTIRIKGKGVVSVETVGAKRPSEYKFLGDNGEVAQVRVKAPQQVWLPQGGLRAPLAAAASSLLVGHGAGAKK